MIANKHDFGFSNSKSKELVQLANLIAGIIAIKYETGKDNQTYSMFSELIANKSIMIHEWPLSYNNYIEQYDNATTGKYDKLIYLNSIRLAKNFVMKKAI